MNINTVDYTLSVDSIVHLHFSIDSTTFVGNPYQNHYTKDPAVAIVYNQGSNLFYFGARYYDAELGRWTSTDPADQFWDSYMYCGVDPVNFTDPDGRLSGLAGGMIIGGISGAVTGAVIGAIVFNANGEDWRKGLGVGAAIGGWAGFVVGAGIGDWVETTGPTVSVFNEAPGNGSYSPPLRENDWDKLRINIPPPGKSYPTYTFPDIVIDWYEKAKDWSSVIIDQTAIVKGDPPTPQDRVGKTFKVGVHISKEEFALQEYKKEMKAWGDLFDAASNIPSGGVGATRKVADAANKTGTIRDIVRSKRMKDAVDTLKKE
jgi:RHS repeat-associated protein